MFPIEKKRSELPTPQEKAFSFFRRKETHLPHHVKEGRMEDFLLLPSGRQWSGEA